MQQTTSTIKNRLSQTLSGQLGIWQFNDPAKTQLPSLWVGMPPNGTRMIAPGVEVIIADSPQPMPTPYMNGQVLMAFSHQVDMQLWYPEDLEPADETALQPALTALSGLSDVNGRPDGPLYRVVMEQFFLHWGRPIVSGPYPRTEKEKQRCMISLMSFNLN